MQKGSLLIGVLLLAFLLSTSIVSADGIIQEVSNGGVVDWGRLSIRCTGLGECGTDTAASQEKKGAIESARADALEKILLTLDAIAITSETTVAEALHGHQELQDRIRDLAEKFREKSVHYMSDGSVEIEVELALRGELVDALLPPFGKGKRVPDGLLCPLCGQPWPQDREIPDDLILDRAQGDQTEAFTGLVIDARGLGLRPALAPQVLNESGKTIYSVDFARRPRALVAGLVGYEEDPDLIAKKNRVAPKPLVIEATRVRGSNKADVVIENQDAALLHSLPKHLQFMLECRVIIVTD